MELSRISGAVLVGFLAICASSTSLSANPGEVAGVPDPAAKLAELAASPEAVEKGRQVYGNTCLFCHGPEGVGARAPNLVEGMFKPGRDGEVPYAYNVIVDGRAGTIMGAFKEVLSDEEIWDVMAYLRSQGHRVIEERKAKRKKK